MTLYDDLGGFDALLGLCRRWHELCLADPLTAHPFTAAPIHPFHDERLAAYLTEVTGGPRLYTAGFGDESSMLRLHAGNGVHRELDDAAVDAFERAVTEVGMTGEAGARLGAYFRRATYAMDAYAEGPHLVADELPLNHVDG